MSADDAEPRRRRRGGGGGKDGGAPGASAKPRTVWRGAPNKPASNQGSREVIVRVTGRTSSPRSLTVQFAYNTREGTLLAEHSSGRVLDGLDELRALQRQWVRENHALARNPSCPTQSLGVVLSMPAGTSPAALRAAGMAWAREHMSPRTEWLAVQHHDKAHPHLHVSVRSVQYDGRRVTATRAEVQRWRESFALGLQAHGIAADATPQRDKVQRLLTREHELRREDRAPEVRLPGFERGL